MSSKAGYEQLKLDDVITTSTNNIYRDTISPLLSLSKYYDRGVAYFHLEWILMAKKGLLDFINNGGRMRLLTSIEVDDEVYVAFEHGEEAKINEVLKEELIDKIKSHYSNEKSWALDYLSYLVSTKLLEVKVAVHKRNKIHIYHDKLSFFRNDDDIVCLHGSLNDSYNATQNYESIDIFKSWLPHEKKRIDRHYRYFEELWSKRNKSYIILTLSDYIISGFKKIGDPTKIRKTSQKPNILSPRDYQISAINALKSNNWNGILEMATGTGKTLTSLFALKEANKELNSTVNIIVAPQVHLVYQWQENIKKIFPHSKILICAISKAKWGSDLFYELNSTKSKKNHLVILTTYNTLIDETFINATKNIPNLIYIFDECHKLGTNKILNRFNPAPDTKKIGLSATPNRWLDDKGNKYIEMTIGKTVYEYSLEKAIKDKKLTPYHYHIHLVELTPEETYKFSEITKEIYSLFTKIKDVDEDETNAHKKLKRKLQERAAIAKSSINKFDKFFSEFDKLKQKNKTIVYVHNLQVEKMVNLLRKRYNINVHGIFAETPIEKRNKILKSFNKGDVDVLVAIKCLDEGVDITNCSREYILASSTNPREFIQRRGRVLRKTEGKRYSEIHDFVTIATTMFTVDENTVASIITRELPRVAEFVRLSEMKFEADSILYNYLKKHNLLSAYQKNNPWNINKNSTTLEDNGNYDEI